MVPASRLAGIAFGSFVRHPFTAVGQRICSSATLLSPGTPRGTRYYLPPYAVFPNTIEIERDVLISPAFDLTKGILTRTQLPNQLVWWWRPGLPLAAAALTYVALAVQRRRMALGAALLVGLLAGTFIVGSQPTFEAALPLYLVAAVSATLVVTLRR